MSGGKIGRLASPPRPSPLGPSPTSGPSALTAALDTRGRGCYECLVHTRARVRLFAHIVARLLAALALGACEDGMTRAEAPPPSLDTMPRAPAPAASAPAPESQPVADVDGGAPADTSYHAVLVTICAVDKRACLLAQGSPTPEDSSYRVVLGRGVGAIRTRGQAMADLYTEMRARTGAGGHLMATPHHIGEPPANLAASPRSRAAADDPLVEAAFNLMEAVDRDGEVTIDAAPSVSAGGCKVAVGSLEADAGAARCLVGAPAASSSMNNTSGRGGRGR
jgi:hypothetical protein